jgi:hypothetical protein
VASPFPLFFCWCLLHRAIELNGLIAITIITIITITVQEMLKGVRYGFNNQYSGLFSQIQEEVRSHCNKLNAQLLSAPAISNRPGPLQCCAPLTLTFVCRRQRSWSCPVPTPLPPANGESCGY